MISSVAYMAGMADIPCLRWRRLDWPSHRPAGDEQSIHVVGEMAGAVPSYHDLE